MFDDAGGPKAGGPVALRQTQDDGGRAARSADAPVRQETLKQVMAKLEEALRLSLELERSEEPSERG